MTRWIPISERLPEQFTWCIVTVSDAQHYFVTEALFNGRWLCHGEYVDVVAWMLLPEPYRPD